jgi:hypothetical protein
MNLLYSIVLRNRYPRSIISLLRDLKEVGYDGIEFRILLEASGMKKNLRRVFVLVFLFAYQSAFTASGALFNVSATGNPTASPISITLCLNGKGPLSCQTYTVTKPYLTIRTTIPNHTYPIVGIKINSPNVRASDLIGCTPYPNGLCLFSVSNTQPANILIKSLSTYTINGTITGLTASGLVLQNNGGDNLNVPDAATSFQFASSVAYGGSYNVTVQHQPITGLVCSVANGLGTNVTSNVTNVSVNCIAPIVFLSRTTTFGDMSNNSQNLTGLTGANVICNSDAQAFGTPAVKAHSNYMALLITASLTPCSKIGSEIGCAGKFATPTWPLKPGSIYFSSDETPFETVTSKAIFPDRDFVGSSQFSYPNLLYPDGVTPVSTSFWFGPQSIYLNTTQDGITGWAYANLANSNQYASNFALCDPTGGVIPGMEWTSSSIAINGALGLTASPFHCAGACGTPDEWQNYYSNQVGDSIGDTFSTAQWLPCGGTQLSIICISSPL